MHKAVIYIHGFLGHLRFPELTRGLDPARVFAPDLLGYGIHAGAPKGDMTVAHQADHVARFIEQYAGPQPVVLVGHSAGAAVAVRYAKTHPHRVAAFVSAEGNLAPSDAFLSSRLAPMMPNDVAAWLASARNDPARLLASSGYRLTGEPLDRLAEWLNHQPAEVIHAGARAVLMETLRPGYASDVMAVMDQIPTYLIQGERTPAGMGVPSSLRERAAGHVVIPGTGHAMVLEKPADVASVVAGVIARQVWATEASH